MVRKAHTAEDIEAFVFAHIAAHPGDIAVLVGEHFGISRQAVSRHLRRLVEEQNIDRFSAPLEEDYGFVRTSVPVALARQGEENLISRSQAKHLLARFDRFKEVILDFAGIETIGQAFADEVFRVFADRHPGINLIPIHTVPEVEKMIRRALAARSARPAGGAAPGEHS